MFLLGLCWINNVLIELLYLLLVVEQSCQKYLHAASFQASFKCTEHTV